MWFEYETRGFESLCLTFSLLLQFMKGFEFITQRFESSCLVLHEGFESLCRWFESVLQSLHLFFIRDSNRCIGDSNPWLLASLLLHQGFESLEWWFESVYQSIPCWNLDSNSLRRDSNHSIIEQLFRPFVVSKFEFVIQGFESRSSYKLTGIGIRITRIMIRIIDFNFAWIASDLKGCFKGFESNA